MLRTFTNRIVGKANVSSIAKSGVLRAKNIHSLRYSFSLLQSIENQRMNQLIVPKMSRSFAKKKGGKEEESVEQSEEVDLEMIEMQYAEVVEELADALTKLQFGSLSPEMIEELEVKAYGDICSMIEVAQVIPKNDKTALLNVYDPSVYEEVKTCLDLCDLDLTIQKDPQGFLLTLANANSKEARLQFAESVKQKGQEYLQKLRNIRGDEIKEVKQLQGFGEDYLYQAEQEIHNMYLEASKNIDSSVAAKLSTVGL